MVVRAQKRAGGREAVCACVAVSSDAAEVGFARSYSEQFEEVYRRNPVGQRVGAAGRGDARRADDRCGRGRRRGGRAGPGGRAARKHRGEPAAPRQCLCAADRRRARPAGGTVPAAARAGQRGQRRARLAGRPISIAPAARSRAIRADATRSERQQVAHIKALHPRDDHYGMGCIEAAIAAASVHNRASRWNKALLDNAARPSGALSYEPADGSVLSAEQFQRLKEELASEFAGSGECRAAAAARGRAEVAGAEPDPGRHGFRGFERRRGAGHRARLRRSPGAGRVCRGTPPTPMPARRGGRCIARRSCRWPGGS